MVYWFNREELLQKRKDKYINCGGKEKAAEYYLENKEALGENVTNKYKNLSKEEEETKTGYSRNR